MDNTPNLQLPYLIAAQAQKHVTHNEALRGLDAIVQLSVLDKDLASPPGAPADGSRYIVAASPTGAWAGQTANIAAWQDGAWAFYTPREGWLAWVADEDKSYVYSGSAWAELSAPGTGAPLWGINATADTTNRPALKSPASLFDNVGNGHQQKINKAAAGDTASQLFQTGYSGRAEYGLTGDDDFHVKVSPNGSLWMESILIDRTTGYVQVPSSRLNVVGAGARVGVKAASGDPGHEWINAVDAVIGRLTQSVSSGNFTLDTGPSGGVGLLLGIAYGTGNFGIGVAGGGTNKLSVEGIAAPETDNAYTCGTSGKRWSEVYAATGTINTSDARHKTDIADSPLGLSFILELKPRAYRWRDGATVVEWEEEEYTVEEPVTEARTVTETVHEVVGGQVEERRVEKTVQVPVVDVLPVVDEAGAPVMVPNPDDAEAAWVRKLHAVPRLATVRRTRKVKREVARPGARTHYGLVAQEVKAALDAAGVADFAGWVLGDKGDPNSTQGLRYDQFIAPLIKAVQELSARVAALEAQRGA